MHNASNKLNIRFLLRGSFVASKIVVSWDTQDEPRQNQLHLQASHLHWHYYLWLQMYF